MATIRTRSRTAVFCAVVFVSTFVALQWDLNLVGQAAIVWSCAGAYIAALWLIDRRSTDRSVTGEDSGPPHHQA